MLGKYAEGGVVALSVQIIIGGSGSAQGTRDAEAHSPSAITRMTFGVMDIERRAIPCLSLAYPMLISLSDSDEVSMRSR